MRTRFFHVYQYLAPLVLTPLAYWLWLDAARGDHRLALWMVGVPVLFAYVVPAVGTNVLRIWEINTRLRLGRFRPHHGFVFGSATACMVWLAIPTTIEPTIASTLRAGFIVGSVLAFWNWLYDAAALHAGFLRVYTRSYAEGRGPDAIALDYAPPIFGMFGFAYGASAGVASAVLAQPGWTVQYWLALLGACCAAVAFSIAGYVAWSYCRFGEHGLRSHEGARGVPS